MLDPNEIIEENKGIELEQFENEVERLTQDQLEQINVDAGIYTLDRVKGIHRDLLEISIGEVRWPKYFASYRTVTGEASALETKIREIQ